MALSAIRDAVAARHRQTNAGGGGQSGLDLNSGFAKGIRASLYLFPVL